MALEGLIVWLINPNHQIVEHEVMQGQATFTGCIGAPTASEFDIFNFVM